MTGNRQTCRICGEFSGIFAHAGLLPQIIKKQVSYAECSNCGYVQTEHPFWLEHAYRETINACDTGILQRNLANVQVVISILFTLNLLNGRVVDAAGGFGILTRLLRDRGINTFWNDKYCQNLLARGFEYQHDSGKAELVTAFEAFEHFVEPGNEIEKLLDISPNILLSTYIVPDPTPKPEEWWYYGLDHGQHIGFYKVRTLQYLADKYDKKLLTNGTSHHLFTSKKVNSYYWKAALRTKKIVSYFTKFKIKSKTWDDHLKLSNPTDLF